MQILNKTANVRQDICYRATSDSKILDMNTKDVERIISVFKELSKEEKSVANIEDLNIAAARVRERHLTKVRVLENEQRNQRNAGYVLISGLTLAGIMVVGVIIFAIIKLIIK